MMRATLRRIGLTGGIGSGKSEVARVVSRLGATLVDTDALARELTAPGGAAIAALVAAFGAQVLDADGGLDRPRMRERAFADAHVKHQLQAILHPAIAERARAWDAEADANAVLVFDVPLLTESPWWRTWLQRVIVVDCAVETQIARVIKRSGWSRELVESVIAQQASRARRLAIADAVIDNDGISLDQLAQRVRAVWTAWGLPRTAPEV